MVKKNVFVILVCFAGLTFAAQAFAQVSSPAAVKAADSSGAAAAAALVIGQFITSVKISGAVAWGIQLAKNSKLSLFNWISNNTPWLNRAIALLAAALTASGVNYIWNANPDGTHQLIVDHIGLASIGIALWHTGTNYLYQKGWYKGVFAEPAQPEVAGPAKPVEGAAATV